MNTQLIVRQETNLAVLQVGGPVPILIQTGDKAVAIAWDDCFAGKVRNEHTRLAYERHVRHFLSWATHNNRTALAEITAGDVGRYIRSLAPEKKSLSKKKQALSALRKFFNLAVERHICIINPAAVAETERLRVGEGKTPLITYEDAWQLYQSVDSSTLLGKRDLAIFATLNFSGARAGSVALLDIDNLYQVGEQWMLHFDEKNNCSRELPLPHDQYENMFAWLEASGLRDQRRRRDGATNQWIPRPIFRTFSRKTDQLAPYQHEQRDPRSGQLIQKEKGRMSGRDICDMMKRRLKKAGLSDKLSPHSWRAAAATDLDAQGVPLKDIQDYLGHSDPRTTQL